MVSGTFLRKSEVDEVVKHNQMFLDRRNEHNKGCKLLVIHNVISLNIFPS